MKARIAELVRFALVGLSSTLFYLGLYSLLVLVGTAYVLASLVAFLVSVTLGYVLHHRFTFRTPGGSAQSAVRWLALQGSLLVTNLVLLSVMVQAAGVDRIVAQILILPLIPALSYVVSRRLVFDSR